MFHGSAATILPSLYLLQLLPIRNLLSIIPPCLCQLRQLEVLLASNNHLVSLPEEIGKLHRLQQLDVSCNEITHLPDKIGDLERLRSLDVRKNLLVELPIGICRLRLRRLDFSSNRIAHIPCDIRKVETLEHLLLDNNPLLSPPANICTRGLVHIMKFFNAQAARNDARKDIMYRSDLNIRGTIKRSHSCLPPGAADDMDTCSRLSHDALSSHHSLVNSGYITGITERPLWSRSECDENSMLLDDDYLYHDYRTRRSKSNINPDDISKAMALRAAETTRGFRTDCHSELNNATRTLKTPENGLQKAVLKSPKTTDFVSSGDADEFTRELQRQRADYDARRKRAEQLRLSVEEDRRNSSLKVNEQFNKQQNNDEQRRSNSDMPHSRSFSEVSRQTIWQLYQRTSSDTPTSTSTYNHTNGATPASPTSPGYGISATTDRLPSAVDSGITDSALLGNGLSARQCQTLPRRSLTSSSPNDSNYLPLEAEFRRRHEAMVAQQHREAHDVLRRLEEMKQNNATDIQKVEEEVTERSWNDGKSGEVGETVSVGHRSPDSSNGDVNGFTIRRNKQQADNEKQQVEQLRKMIETVLKIKLPEDMNTALKDGVILCHLANHMRPHSVTSIHVPSPAVPKLTLAKCRRNVENFLLACRRVGVTPNQLCSSSAVLEDRDRSLCDVAMTVRALIECTAQQPKQSAV